MTYYASRGHWLLNIDNPENSLLERALSIFSQDIPEKAQPELCEESGLMTQLWK